uniref:Ig-like domain-containing protein n=1 Tax=Callorhinchus milii TaxID=7868 RepID=A0A4W3JST6_CALMI
SLWAETLTVLVSLTLGAASVAPIVVIEPDPDIPVADSGESIIATCLAKYAKAAASINWESPFNFSFTQSATPPAPDGTVTISSPLRLSPTREMNGKYVYCVVEHPALKTPE